MTLNNNVIPFQLGNNSVRGNIVRLQTVVSKIVKRHEYPTNVESLFADTLTITACLGSRMKHDGVFTIQAKGTGDVHTLFSDITSDGFLRGYVGLNTGFKTQFADGFTYPNDSIAVSKFMAPGYMNLALGTDYVKDANFSVFGSPFAAKTTFVMDDSLSQIGSFGVEKGERIRYEFGAFLKLKWNAELMKNIEMKSKLELFSNYLNNPQNIDVNAELLFVFRVNSLFSATAQWNLIYDDDIQIRDINGKVGPRTQFKSVLGIGISYKLEN